MTTTLADAYHAGADDHEHACGSEDRRVTVADLVESTQYWVDPPESPAHAEAWAQGWLAAHQKCIEHAVARARADGRNAALANQPELRLDLTDEALREACRVEFGWGYTLPGEAEAWIQGYREGAAEIEEAECEQALQQGALDAQNAPLDGAPDDDELRSACTEHYGHEYTTAQVDAWVEGYLDEIHVVSDEQRSNGPHHPSTGR